MAAVDVPSHKLFLPLFLLTLSFSPTSLLLPEDDALLKLKHSLTLLNHTNPNDNHTLILSSWSPNSSACKSKWEGVFCNSNHSVTGLRLSSLALSGQIDIDALLHLPSLRFIGFDNNSFDGPIPDLNKLPSLKALFLTTNHFSGPIPPDFFTNLPSIKKIWLDHNNFSGHIPHSLLHLKSLQELHLENNEFSGPIPPFQQNFRQLNLSNNKLEGPIPHTLATKFGMASFSGNQDLCGKLVGKECPEVDHAQQQENVWVRGVILVIMLLVVAMLILLLVRSSKGRGRSSGSSSHNHNHNKDDVVQVHMPSPTTTSNRGSRRVSKRNTMGDLVMVNEEKGSFGLPDLMKASAEVLGNGGMGSAYKATMLNGLAVVVKRMREINKISKDSFDAEMRQFGRMKHLNILTPLAYHYRKEEKLIVSEYIPKGSLLYVLHGDRGTCHAALTWPTRLKIVRGMATGLSFLHTEMESQELPHGNLKSSNVLLSENYEALLNDYAFHPLINPNTVPNSLFAFKTPDYIQYQQVSRKTDVYCLGIIILEIMTGKFPSQYHSNGKGGTDVVQWVHTAISEGREADLIDPDLKNNDHYSLPPMLQLVHIGASCTQPNPQQRLTLAEAISRIQEVQWNNLNLDTRGSME